MLGLAFASTSQRGARGGRSTGAPTAALLGGIAARESLKRKLVSPVVAESSHKTAAIVPSPEQSSVLLPGGTPNAIFLDQSAGQVGEAIKVREPY